MGIFEKAFVFGFIEVFRCIFCLSTSDSLEVIALIVYLGSWVLINTIIAFKFLLNFHLLKLISANNSELFLARLFPSRVASCISPFK
jgi:hypothetical protein